ncbi:MAG: MoaD/ThiS family protein [Anaerolineae bacterium]|nr:MoaD/ThiS family protein [Anaerolineae bacterium]
MNVTFRQKQWTFDSPLTVSQLLKKLRLLPETVLVVRNGQLVTEDQHLQPGDDVRIVAVVSGG